MQRELVTENFRVPQEIGVDMRHDYAPWFDLNPH